MKIVAIIPARGGSKRLSRKNLRRVLGKPMLYYAIASCKESKYEIDFYVSTEDSEIKEIATSLGAKIHHRDSSLSDDITFKQDVVVAALKDIYKNDKEKPDIVLSIQPNSPQISSKIIDEIIDLKISKSRKEIFTVDANLMQNGAVRVMDLSLIHI